MVSIRFAMNSNSHRVPSAQYPKLVDRKFFRSGTITFYVKGAECAVEKARRHPLCAGRVGVSSKCSPLTGRPAAFPARHAVG